MNVSSLPDGGDASGFRALADTHTDGVLVECAIGQIFPLTLISLLLPAAAEMVCVENRNAEAQLFAVEVRDGSAQWRYRGQMDSTVLTLKAAPCRVQVATDATRELELIRRRPRR